jgi:hypothetical protein
MLPPLLFKLHAEPDDKRSFAPHPAATVPTNSHPRHVDPRGHANIMHQLISGLIANGSKLWERPVTDAILNYAVAHHAGLPQRRHNESTLIEPISFQRLCQHLKNDNVLPLPVEIAAAYDWTEEPESNEEMIWMLGLCTRITSRRGLLIAKIKQIPWSQFWSPSTFPTAFSADERVMVIDDKDIMLAACVVNAMIFRHASDRLKNDREFVLEVFRMGRDVGSVFEHVPEWLRADEELALIAVQADHYYEVLQNVSTDLQDKKTVVLAAVTSDGLNLQFASDRLKDNEDVVRAACKQHPSALQYASARWLNNTNLVLNNVRLDGLLLAGVNERLQGDKRVVLVAVRQHGAALQWASDTMRNDKDVVLASLNSESDVDDCPLQYASDLLLDNREFLIKALALDGRGIEFVSFDLQDDKELILAATNTEGMQFLSEELRDDREIVEVSVSNYGMQLEYASARLRNDKAIVMTAVRKHPQALKFASERLQYHPEVRRAAGQELSDTQDVLKDVPKPLRDDIDVVLAAVTFSGESLKSASARLRNNKNVVLAALKQNEDAFAYASDELQQDRDVMSTTSVNN